MNQNIPDLIDELLGYPDLSANVALADKIVEALIELRTLQSAILKGARYEDLYAWARNLEAA